MISGDDINLLPRCALTIEQDPTIAAPLAVDLTTAFVSVVVPHYRDLRALDLCLDSLVGQTLPGSRFEVIVADNNSPEGAEVVERAIAGRARLVIVNERGAGPARNGGVAAATGDILAFIDSDCIAAPDWLAEGLEGLRDYDFIGGMVRVLVGDENRMTPSEAFERVFAFDFKNYILVKGFTGSGNLFCSRALFEHVGGFRVGVSEDVEWSHRARSMGYRLGYAPKAVVGHPARSTWPELKKKWIKTNSETYTLMAEKPLGRLKWLVRTLALPLSAVVHTPRVLLSPELNTPAQRLAGVSMLFQTRVWRFFDGVRMLVRARH